MPKETILQRLAHYEELKSRFQKQGKPTQVSYAEKSVQVLKRRLAQSLSQRG
ncbi:hypothetical protein [Idiomarina sp.]|uniref:hypothetical protein n=1 Tax=Idiomarina sp. TaxID=1874361 RepID=UPI0025BB5696|nr:hypothetical protein [Idiomarina sp.]